MVIDWLSIIILLLLIDYNLFLKKWTNFSGLPFLFDKYRFGFICRPTPICFLLRRLPLLRFFNRFLHLDWVQRLVKLILFRFPRFVQRYVDSHLGCSFRFAHFLVVYIIEWVALRHLRSFNHHRIAHFATALLIERCLRSSRLARAADGSSLSFVLRFESSKLLHFESVSETLSYFVPIPPLDLVDFILCESVDEIVHRDEAAADTHLWLFTLIDFEVDPLGSKSINTLWLPQK